MRTIVGLALACSVAFLIPASVRADDRETALAVIEKAIKAHGGEEALGKAIHHTRSTKVTTTLAGKELSFTAEDVVSLPEKRRIIINIEKQLQFTSVLNGEKGWKQTGGATVDQNKESLEDQREEAYVLWLTTLAPLKKDPFELTPLPEVKVNDQPAVGVKVACKGHKDVKLYFDKSSGLLVKSEHRGREAGVALDKEYLYSHHKEFDGVKVATRVVSSANGRKYEEATLTAFKVLAKPDDKAFEKP